MVNSRYKNKSATTATLLIYTSSTHTERAVGLAVGAHVLPLPPVRVLDRTFAESLGHGHPSTRQSGGHRGLVGRALRRVATAL
jgi:hypothetical protein